MEAQQEALLERARKTEALRADNLKRRDLPSPAQQCIDAVQTWNANECKVVTRMPTEAELAQHAITFEQIVLQDSRVRPQGLLLSAVRSNCVELVETVMKDVGSGVNVRDEVNFNTALHFASVVRGGADMVIALVAAGYRADDKNRYGWTPVDFARQVDLGATAEALTKDHDIDFSVGGVTASYSVEGAVPLTPEEMGARMVSAAVRGGQRDLLRFLLRSGRPDIRDGLSLPDKATGNSPLHLVVINGDTPDLVTELLQAGADPGAKNAQGRTPLQMAETKGRFRTAELLSSWTSDHMDPDYFLTPNTGFSTALFPTPAATFPPRAG